MNMAKGCVISHLVRATFGHLYSDNSVYFNAFYRFYLELKKDPHGPETALFVGNMPPNLSQRQYEDQLLDLLEDGE